MGKGTTSRKTGKSSSVHSSGKIKKKGSGKTKAGGATSGGIRFYKMHGQHILKNPLIIDGMISKAGVKSTDVVLEVGPGTGNLTAKLLEKAAKVHAFEIDPRMVNELVKRFQGTPAYSKLHVFLGDAIKVEDTAWPTFHLCVANLPYQISSPFIFKLAQLSGSYRCAVLMLQKEFADRLLAQPGDKNYCRLSANVRMHMKVERLMKVSRNSFKPPPKVDSTVIRLEPRHPKPPVSFEEWDILLRIVFARKNKRLRANFCVRDVMQKLTTNFNLYQKTMATASNKAAPPPKDVTVDEMQEKVCGILERNGFAESRARSMSEEQLLALLLAFKREGVLFG